MWHPLRLTEDYAVADILTKGRTVFGVGRGYPAREIKTFGAPMINQDAHCELFEDQVNIIFKALDNGSFAHKDKYYTLPPEVPYLGYQLKELTLVPRPINRPVECWQPVGSASGLDFMVKHGIKGAVGGGAATLQQGADHRLSRRRRPRRPGSEARPKSDAGDLLPPRRQQGESPGGTAAAL
jgi:alkanesulfonate monooxygenase SsuD/methylene tetrahydromethanopterin reductase-like flavin-dependent oxidoreductase (luciferase family)